MTDLLKVSDLKTYFPIKSHNIYDKKFIQAVDGVSFAVKQGETLGLVGESGCGKTTLGKTIIGLIPQTAGEIHFQGVDLTSVGKAKARKARYDMQMIFQDPYGCLDPRMNAERIIGEGFRIRGLFTNEERRHQVRKLMEIVGLSWSQASQFPHEFSGGQRQRIGVARALALHPKLVICDEPVSALDMSVQAQILNLLVDLRKEFGLTYIFIAHGLPAVKYISNRIGVMYLGRIVEMAAADIVYDTPLHPYTKTLISAVPEPDPTRQKKEILLEGDVPSPVNPPSGCRFHTRCPVAKDLCKQQEPQLLEVQEGHYCACHFPGSL